MANKVAHAAGAGKSIRLLEEEAAFVGVDVHKKTYAVCVFTEERGPVCGWTQPSSPAALIRRLEPVRDQILWVVYEAGPTGYALVRALWEAGLPADVIAPSRTPQAPGRSGKGDRQDAAVLAFLASRDMLKTVSVPTAQEEADRQVVRRRNQLADELKRAKHRIKSFLLQHGQQGFDRWSKAAVERVRSLELCPELRWSLDSLLADYDHLRAQLDAADRQMGALADTERHAAPVEAVRRVPGVGLTTAMTVCTELFRPERFSGSKQVASFTGVAPCVHRSGETTRSGPILKTGNPVLRSKLVEAAWQWVRHDPAAKALYGRLTATTATPNKAIVGVARHLVILLWRILTRGAHYPPPPPGEDEPPRQSTGQP